MDTAYQKIDSFILFEHEEKRIPKGEKTDLEASTIIDIQGRSYFLVVGSASKKNRKKIILIPFCEEGLNLSIDEQMVYETKDFIKRIKSNDVKEINLEGVSLIGNHLVLANRGNRAYPKNHLVVTDKNFWLRQDEAAISIIELILPDDNKESLGVSELCYIESKDILLMTFTSEASDNSYDDGEIGNSYIGWISNAKHTLHEDKIILDAMFNLVQVDDVFKNEKIEGICVESVTQQELILHLISDNDTGESRLFKISMEVGPGKGSGT